MLLNELNNTLLPKAPADYACKTSYRDMTKQMSCKRARFSILRYIEPVRSCAVIRAFVRVVHVSRL